MPVLIFFMMMLLGSAADEAIAGLYARLDLHGVSLGSAAADQPAAAGLDAALDGDVLHFVSPLTDYVPLPMVPPPSPALTRVLMRMRMGISPFAFHLRRAHRRLQ